MMMLAVMYGMIPSAKIEKLPNAPPENRLRKPSAPCDSTPSLNCLTASASMPGTRMATPRRYSAIITRREQDLVPQIGDLEDVLQVRQHTASSSAVVGR